MKSIKKFELHVTRTRLADRTEPYRRTMSGSDDVAAIARSLLSHRDHEVFLALHVTPRLLLIGYHEAGRGSVDSCMVQPREVFREAIVAGATAVILVHNHPSGECSPSREDVALTKRLADAGTLVGMRVLDHVIVTEESYYSFLDAGLLGEKG